MISKKEHCGRNLFERITIFSMYILIMTTSNREILITNLRPENIYRKTYNRTFLPYYPCLINDPVVHLLYFKNISIYYMIGK